MFTGIVEDRGRVQKIEKKGGGMSLTLACQGVLEDIKIGDSISANGVCLTVRAFTGHDFTADLMPETLMISTFKDLVVGQDLNLERAMSAQGRFGGHMVSGHVDGVGQVVHVTKDANAYRLSFACGQALSRYMVYKGSISIDGVSLTLAGVHDGNFEVSVVPHTMAETGLSRLRPGDRVNIETDIYGRYIEKFMVGSKGISHDFLKDNGYL